ncbi:MAG TPA: hypothetical protein VFS40_04805 [Gemmatimonadales bacterium]|nr:hypothetical protein [Gemmatimonadales bacterium]
MLRPAGARTGSSAAANRNLTIAAAAFLALDGAALVFAATWQHELMLGVVGALLVVAAALVVVFWRWHRRQLEEIAAARRALREEAEALRELLNGA